MDKNPTPVSSKHPQTKLDLPAFITEIAVGDDPIAVMEELEKEILNRKIHEVDPTPAGRMYKAITLFEFNKGLLLREAVSERYKAFSVQFLRDLQKEYQCEKPSERSAAEVATLNFIRILEIQRRINAYFDIGETTEVGVKYFAALSQELDRANRHYLNSLQTLKILKEPALELTIKTQTAIVGKNQVIQSNNK